MPAADTPKLKTKGEHMVAEKQVEWVEFSGSGGTFFKFENEGDELKGAWAGSRHGKYENRLGIVRTHDGDAVFSISRRSKTSKAYRPARA